MALKATNNNLKEIQKAKKMNLSFLLSNFQLEPFPLIVFNKNNITIEDYRKKKKQRKCETF